VYRTGKRTQNTTICHNMTVRGVGVWVGGENGVCMGQERERKTLQHVTSQMTSCGCHGSVAVLTTTTTTTSLRYSMSLSQSLSGRGGAMRAMSRRQTVFRGSHSRSNIVFGWHVRTHGYIGAGCALRGHLQRGVRVRVLYTHVDMSTRRQGSHFNVTLHRHFCPQGSKSGTAYPCGGTYVGGCGCV
jgi:hypothetical protein